MFFFILRIGFSLIFSFLFTMYLVPIFSSIAHRLRVLDVPDGSIKVHERPIPYLGGIAIFFGFIATLALIMPYDNRIVMLLVGSSLLLFVGLIDDILRIKPYQKFFWQMIAGFCFLKSGLYLKESFFLSNIWGIPISFLWILTITNAFNLVDVMDGLATVLASCATFTFIILALVFNQPNLALLLTSLLGALLAFLIFNRPPARIYLGDAGSLFIGGFLATVPFLFNWGTYNIYGFLVPLITLAIPLLELTTLILVRCYKGIPFYYGSPDHFSIYLQQNGWTKYEILAFVLFISLLLLILSLLVSLNRISLIFLLIMSGLILTLWFISIWNNQKKRFLRF